MAFIASHLKGMNRKSVYSLLASTPEISKAEIGRQTGISAPTVIKIIDRFKDIGCVEELGEGASPLGRKPQLLRLNPSFGYAIGVDYNGLELRAGIVDFGGRLCHLRCEKVEPDFHGVAEHKLAACVEALIAESGIPRQKIRGLCVGLPGAINENLQTVDFAPLIGLNSSTDYAAIVEKLSAQLNLPVCVENDANAAATGEFITRGLTERDDLLFVIGIRGIGAGIILDGELRKGHNTTAGEIGYMVFDKDFVSSRQREGWLEMAMRIHAPVENSGQEALLDRFASHFALAFVNICLPLEMNLIVLGRVRGESFDAALRDRINQYLGSLSLLPLQCEAPVCAEPCIVGCANRILKPELTKLLNE